MMQPPRALSLLFAAAGVCVTAQSSLPVVDLGTTVHRAQLNATGEYYSFKNIPYAEPPVGDLRFRLPIPRLTVNRTVNDGSAPRVCPSAGQGWFQYSVPLVIQTLIEGGIIPPAGGPPASSSPQSEDCLLLDVTVPKAVFDAQAAGTLTKRAPVLLWIHGGAYTAGSKDEVNPAGLIHQSRRNGDPGIIFVAINYRLGLFGFPPRKPWMWDVASNAGLYDQRLAMEWVRFNIRRFGGDPNAITVIGESAGAGSILSHLSAFGGIDGTSPFQRAIIQSPAIKPAQDAALYTQLYQDLLTASNTNSYAELRQLSTEQLQAINTAMVGAAPFASSVFGPNVDSLLIPAHPGPLLTHSTVDRSVQVVVAHNADEGLLFTDPRITDQAGFEAYLAGFMPSLPAAKVKHLAEVVYPPPGSSAPAGSLPYTTQVGRTKLAIAEGLVNCFAFGLGLAYGNQTRGYQWSVWPGIHAGDVSYTFWNGESLGGFGVPVAVDAAVRMQRWFVDFAAKGTGAGSAAAELPVYGAGASVVDVNGTAFPVVRDPAANARCRYWLDGLFA